LGGKLTRFFPSDSSSTDPLDQFAASRREAEVIPASLSFFKFLIFVLLILYPLFVVWYFVSPRTYNNFTRRQPATSENDSRAILARFPTS